MTLRWGVVATGSISRTLVEEITATEGCEVVAVASRSAARARGFADAYRIPGAYGDVAEMAADPAVDAVYIGSTHQHHLPAALAAIDAGKAVLCEKPLTVSADQAREMVEAARRRGVFLMEAMWMRCNPAIRRMLDLIADGAIGTVRHVSAALGSPPAEFRRYRMTDPALGGGALLDMGVYPLTFVHLLLGDPDRVAAVGVVDAGVDLATVAALGWGPDGEPASASVATSMLAPLPNEAVVLGEHGSIALPAPFHRPNGLAVSREDGEPEWLDIPFRGKGYVHEVEEVRRCLAAGLTESPLVPLDDTLAIMDLMDRVRGQIGLAYPVE